METQSRRSFMKAAGTTLLIAGLTGMGLAGCDSSKKASGMDASSAADFTWDEETDVLVVGAGLAGTSAAVAIAKSDPEARCLLLEKGASPPRQRKQPVLERLVHAYILGTRARRPELS